MKKNTLRRILATFKKYLRVIKKNMISDDDNTG